MAGRRRVRRWESGPALLELLGVALFVTAVYVVVVRGGEAFLGHANSPTLALSVVATAIVALGFQPVRRWLRPVAARLVRGERAAPYDLLTRFVEEVAGGYRTDEIPDRMARLLAEATAGEYAQVWLSIDGRLVLAATWPPDAGSGLSRDTGDSPGSPGSDGQAPPEQGVHGGRWALPVSHADEVLGMLVVQERDRQPLTPVEEQLLAGLAAQAGLVLRSVRLRTELALRLRESVRRARDLRASRERIVITQDEERRRLERDIHDGAQQHLVALAVNLRLARTLVARSSERAPAVLAGLKTAAEDTIDTLADLSRGIYPRLLTDDGLAAALRAAVASSSVPVELTVDESRCPRGEVTAALYFCCLEALQNVAKHSGATGAAVRITREADRMELVVADDGAGFAPGTAGGGSGLANMRDRAESLGGRIGLDSKPGHGTVVRISIPAIDGGR
ncbi:MAG TPA: ATP-binding protein [Pseudonocardiaceae bacterium]|jgi:signal transduction histidine kinase